MRYCPTCDRVYKRRVRYCDHDGTALVAMNLEQDPLIGKVLADRYVLERRLGVGGMGFVYAATQRGLGRQVAVKLLFAERAADLRSVERLRREALALAALDHPGIVRVLDHGEGFGGAPFIVMERVKGQSLERILSTQGTLSVAQAVEVGAQLARALSFAHSYGVIHRDLKPGNIQLDIQGDELRARVLDFGMALLHTADESLIGDAVDGDRLTRQGIIVGTPQYMAPEQIQGTTPDARSDIYSLGVVLQEMLSGSPPFTAQQPAAVCAMHVKEPPPPLRPLDAAPEMHDALQSLLSRLLAKKPDARPQDAEEVASILMELRARLPEPTASLVQLPQAYSSVPGGPDPLEQAFKPRGRLRMVLAVSAAAASGAGVATFLLGSESAAPELAQSRPLPPLVAVASEDALRLAPGLQAPGGLAQMRYEGLRRRVEAALAQRGLRIRDLRLRSALLQLWLAQEEAARTAAFDDANVALEAFQRHLSKLDMAALLRDRLSQLEMELDAPAGSQQAIGLRALRATVLDASRDGLRTRTFLERMEALAKPTAEGADSLP